MSFRAATSLCLAVAALPLAACNQLEPIAGDTDSGGGGGIPPAVRAAFEGSCGKSGCHAAGGTAPTLAGSELDAILTGSGGGLPYVTLGDTSNSYIAIVMMPDALLSALGVTRAVSRMPLDGDFKNPNIQTILAWIGGAEFEGGGGTTTGDGSTGGSTGGEPPMPTFTNVQAIFTAKCSCHLTDPGPANGNVNLAEGMAYQNIVNVKSPTTALDLIEPSNPDQSFLYLKLSMAFKTVPGGELGSQMPLGTMLTADEVALIEEWITLGAMND